MDVIRRRGPARLWRSPLVVVATVAVTLVAAESAATWLDHRSAPTLEYHSENAQQLVDDMDRLAAAGIGSDIAFVGTSMTGYGIDTSVVEATMTDVETANNLALNGAQTTVVRRWLLEEVIPRVDPEVVVWGVSTLDFNANRGEDSLAVYNGARATRRGILGALDRWLADHLALSRRRQDLRDPARVLDAVFDPFSDDEPTPPTSELANYTPVYFTVEQLAAANPEFAARLRETDVRLEANALRDFAIGDELMNAFATTLNDVRGRGIRTAVVLMPTSTVYRDAHPGGPAEYERAIARIREAALGAGAIVLDHSNEFDDESFFDDTHVGPDARRRLSEAVAAELEEAGIAS